MASAKLAKVIAEREREHNTLEAEIAKRAERGDAMPSGEQAERWYGLMQRYEEQRDEEILAAELRGYAAVQAYADALGRTFDEVAQDHSITNKEIAKFTGASEQDIALV